MLTLSGNNLASLPDWVYSVLSLEKLDVSRNPKFNRISEKIGSLEGLKGLLMHGNQIS